MKWLAITVIIILAIATIGGGYFYWQQTSKLAEANSEIVALEGNAASLEGKVSSLEGNVSTLETNLADSEATVATLGTDLEAANAEIDGLQADVSTQRTINSALSAELETVKDPRHFESLQELTDWLEQDDTNTKYADEDLIKMSYILMIRAVRDGYLLSVSLWASDGDVWVSNDALIGTSIYSVNAWDDQIIEWFEGMQPQPSHPLPLQ